MPKSYAVRLCGLPDVLNPTTPRATKLVGISDSIVFTRELPTTGQGWRNGGHVLLSTYGVSVNTRSLSLRLGRDSVGAVAGPTLTSIATASTFVGTVTVRSPDTAGQEGKVTIALEYTGDAGAATRTMQSFTLRPEWMNGGSVPSGSVVRVTHRNRASGLIMRVTVTYGGVTNTATINSGTGTATQYTTTDIAIPNNGTNSGIITVAMTQNSADGSQTGRIFDLQTIGIVRPGNGVAFDYIGVGGTDTDDWNGSVVGGGMYDTSVLTNYFTATGVPDVVGIAIGQNDTTDITGYQTKISNVITSAYTAMRNAGNADPIVCVIGPYDWTGGNNTNLAIIRANQLAEVQSQLSLGRRVCYVDLQEILGAQSQLHYATDVEAIAGSDGIYQAMTGQFEQPNEAPRWIRRGGGEFTLTTGIDTIIWDSVNGGPAFSSWRMETAAQNASIFLAGVNTQPGGDVVTPITLYAGDEPTVFDTRGATRIYARGVANDAVLRCIPNAVG